MNDTHYSDGTSREEVLAKLNTILPEEERGIPEKLEEKIPGIAKAMLDSAEKIMDERKSNYYPDGTPRKGRPKNTAEQEAQAKEKRRKWARKYAREKRDAKRGEDLKTLVGDLEKEEVKNEKGEVVTFLPDYHLVPAEAVERFKEQVRGRPMLYRVEMCEEIVGILAEGRTLEDAAAILGVAEVTFKKWCDAGSEIYHPEFAEAVDYGKQLSGLWWREIGRMNVYNKNFNATLFMMNMQNRFGWTRKLEGKIENINEERKVLEVSIKDNRSEDHLGEILRILHESGAIEAGVEEAAQTEDEQVHSAHPDTQAGSLSLVKLS
jgi:hypothetical protein